MGVAKSTPYNQMVVGIIINLLCFRFSFFNGKSVKIEIYKKKTLGLCLGSFFVLSFGGLDICSLGLFDSSIYFAPFHFAFAKFHSAVYFARRVLLPSTLKGILPSRHRASSQQEEELKNPLKFDFYFKIFLNRFSGIYYCRNFSFSEAFFTD